MINSKYEIPITIMTYGQFLFFGSNESYVYHRKTSYDWFIGNSVQDANKSSEVNNIAFIKSEYNIVDILASVQTILYLSRHYRKIVLDPIKQWISRRQTEKDASCEKYEKLSMYELNLFCTMQFQMQCSD